MHRIKCDKDTEIKQKLKSILIEKNRLKLLKQSVPTKAPTTLIAKSPSTKTQIVVAENEQKLNKSNPIAVASGTATSSNVQSTDSIKQRDKDSSIQAINSTKNINENVKFSNIFPIKKVIKILTFFR